MAGIYIHIPFCKTRCVYCDFFSSTKIQNKKAYISLICKELQDRKDYLNGQPIDTIYFGGGTPSVLSASDFQKIFSQISLLFTIYHLPEITLEANPDDITSEYLQSIQQLPFNRISLGIQSFNDYELQFLNRRHDSAPAIQAVQLCQNFGFKNISIDLMYGLPSQTLETWKSTIRQALALNIQHISAYHLIYEEGTKLHRLLKAGKVQAVEEDTSIRMFEMLIDCLTEAGFEHYEISNFSLPNYSSKHNSAYWNGTPYLGIGAAAHSYNGISRQWNQPMKNGTYEAETEILDEKDIFNDFIITRFRTMKGIDLNEIQLLFGEEAKQDCLTRAQKYFDNQCLQIADNHLRLTRQGIFISDGIMRDLIR